ncbi:class I SAM-dependent methyltransferase [Ekhidna sp.]|uniref:class I SAM-dependent methyltransferase n=1 Tax=Ekhidna sp. TaxID=2608089 RepID=UPI003BAB3CD2
MNLKSKIRAFPIIKDLLRAKFYYQAGKSFFEDSEYQRTNKLIDKELSKEPSRTEIINYILSQFSRDTNYLEIGVRYPSENFDKIKATRKVSVDPGVEYDLNPVDYKLTSDEFFEKLNNKTILQPSFKFDVIFIDGLHLADQVDRDIKNSFDHLSQDGFIVLHDCNPPTEWHARYDYSFRKTPAEKYWNGTTWKAFLKWRKEKAVFSCCVDSDWGVGVISKYHQIGDALDKPEEFYEFNNLMNDRQSMLNLVSFDQFIDMLNK